MTRDRTVATAWIRLVATAGILLAGCSSSSSSPPAPAGSGTIGTAGGAVRVTSGSLTGTSVEIAAGVLTGDVSIAIYTDSATAKVETDIVGPAARFSPSDYQLAQDAVFTIPFDPTALPAGTVASSLRVAARASNGRNFTTIVPTAVDTSAAIVTFATDRFATFWVTAPTAYSMARYFVLDDGNRYEYEGGNALEVTSTTTEPNFEGRPIWKYEFLMPFFARSGVYLEDDASSGGLLFLGQLDEPQGLPSQQEVAQVPFELLRAAERVGAQRTDSYDYIGYSINRPSPPAQIYTGEGTVSVSIVEERSIDTPVGRFDKCLLVEFGSTYTDTRPSTGAGRSRLWLAPDIGPVMIQRGDETPQALLQAIVGGTVIRGQ